MYEDQRAAWDKWLEDFKINTNIKPPDPNMETEKKPWDDE